MLKTVIMNELRKNVLSLRLHIALFLTFCLFGIGTAAFVASQKSAMSDYSRFESQQIEALRKRAENLSQYATQRQNLLLKPRDFAFVDDAREKYLPDSFEFNAYNVFGFTVRQGAANPYLQVFRELNWLFIVSIVISFTVLLLSFDMISGEKESRTLAVSLSNPVSRTTLLLGKFLSVVISSVSVLLPGMCLSLIIVLTAGVVTFSGTVMLEILMFGVAVIVFIACMTAVGMLTSVCSRSPNVSLLLSLALWLLFVAIVPNTALFWSQTIFPIRNADAVYEEIRNTKQEINNSAPQGSWASSGDNPFLPQHELRAANQTNLMNAEKRIRDDWYMDMIRQVKRTRLVTLVSPVSLFEYMSEAIVDGGLVRFLKNWDDLRAFQQRLLVFFKDKDAADPESPHWYNPYEDYSTTRKPVSFDEIPRYTEKSAAPGARLYSMAPYAVVMILYTVLMFAATYVVFLKYDVR